ncbi:DUF4439 domain-containing protein [Cellulosimicrobium marinum]|uniref:DUF4439 domain-containing protein n=1 Tax=Cellulosimicrobium marinum TaxID=1638992 RepID=UPI001E5A2C68|nr:DUF4439 domain-containing protein [Cellulosimicrobium marinum]MCB7137705.1 ferritin-like domain-containing protein [Cellulosimicrobium marinum]
MTPDATAAAAPGTAALPTVTTRRARPVTSRRRGRAALALGLMAAVLLTGCGVRLETPEPTEPSPDAREVARRTAVDDALAVAELAEEVAPSSTDAALVAALDQAASFARLHADALGGEYDSGLPDPEGATDATGTPTVEVTTTAPGATTGTVSPGASEAPIDDTDDEAGAGGDGAAEAPPTAEDVVVALVGATQRTRASADATRDADLARLLGSVATSELVSARRLAALTGSDAAADLPVGAAPVAEAPTGVGAADLATLVAAEDAAGYAYEVRAARSDGDARSDALARAEVHRARAQGWALAAGTDGTDQDPRRTAYAVPDDDAEATSALAQRLETELAQSYASLVATAAAGSREDPLALLADSWLAALGWGAEPVPFPGMAEQAP